MPVAGGYLGGVPGADGESLESTPDVIAARAGLRYLSDDRRGVRRRRRGRGFSYHRDDGRPIGDVLRLRIAELAIPPAWRDVWIALEADAHLQATGFDDRGRKQYLYHPLWREEADVAKFERLASFAGGLVALRRQVAADMASDGRDRLCAAAVRLIDECLIRPGSRRHFEANGSVGATTLRSDHVEIRRDLIMLDFVGKGGADHHLELRDRQLAKTLGELLDSARRRDALFASCSGATIDEVCLNRYIEEHAGEGFTAKDLRTWGATTTVVGELADKRSITDGTAADATVRAAVEVAAAALGNTPAVGRASYVAPAVIDANRSGALADVWRRTRPGRWLSRAERATDRVLGDAAQG